MNKVKARLKEIYSYRASYIMMAPFLVLFFLFVVWPVIMSIGMSFTSFNVFDTRGLLVLITILNCFSMMIYS